MSEEKKHSTESKKTTKKATHKPKVEETTEVHKTAHHEKGEVAAVVVKKSTHKTQYGKGIQFLQTGKRKNATARVIIRPGSGKYLVNDKYDLVSYFGNRQSLLILIQKPMKVAQMEGQYDIFANVNGGGKSGQAGAIAHGIAKAIVAATPEIKKQLKIEGMITRDSRVKESKKYGRKKARKGYTYRKR